MIVMHLTCNICQHRTESFVQYGGDCTTLIFQQQGGHALRLVHREGLRAWVRSRLGRAVGPKEADQTLDDGLYAVLVSENINEDETFLSPMSVWPRQRTLPDAFCPRCHARGLEIIDTAIV